MAKSRAGRPRSNDSRVYDSDNVEIPYLFIDNKGNH